LRGVLWLGLGLFAAPGRAQSIAFDIRPGKLEVAVDPGTEMTVGFRVQTAAAAAHSRETLVLESTDWTVSEDGSLSYMAAGTVKDSASPWIQFTPSAFALIPAMNQLVRITIAVPAKAVPGVYRTGIFVQERPPATAPQARGPSVMLRVRYAFFLYVIVPPAKAQPDVTGVEVQLQGPTGRVQCTLKNRGNLHVRPLLRWAVKNAQGEMAGAPGEHDATVLLPQSTLREIFQFPAGLPPGRYQMAVMVDFRDGGPLQSMTVPFDVPPN
jgi:P pilus assembly chaperone PapD